MESSQGGHQQNAQRTYGEQSKGPLLHLAVKANSLKQATVPGGLRMQIDQKVSLHCLEGESHRLRPGVVCQIHELAEEPIVLWACVH